MHNQSLEKDAIKTRASTLRYVRNKLEVLMNKIKMSFILLILPLVGCTSVGIVNERTKLAEQGNLQAQHDLCYGYRYADYGLPTDYAKAHFWCSKMAKRGWPDSITLFAELYYHGLGVDQDFSIAFNWYMKAAERGHLHAQYMIGHMYLYGQGVAMNKEQAYKWTHRSIESGSEHGKELLAKILKERH